MEKNNQNIACMDLGGTYLKLCAYNYEGVKVLDTKLVEISENRDENSILELIVESVKGIEENIGSAGMLSLGIPGLVNFQKGIVYSSPHFPSWEDFELVKRLKLKFPEKRIYMDNDANLHALGEAREGVGKSYRNFVMLTLGTGIGGGIIIDGKLIRGGHGTGGEFGHMTVEPEGRKCNCGNRGCLERYASAEGIMIDSEESGITISDVKDLMERAGNGDTKSIEIVKKFSYYLAIGIGNLVNVFSPETVVLGGGIAESFEVFRNYLMEELKGRLFPELYKRIKVVKAQLRYEAGLKGCFYSAIEGEKFS